MAKKIKVEAIIELSDDTYVDDSLLKRTISSLGNVESCKVDNNFEDISLAEKPSNTPTSDMSISEIDHVINDANKIYFGTLSIDERKFVAASILHSASITQIKADSGYKSKLNKTFLDKLELDSNYSEHLLNQDKDESVLGTLKDKFLEGDLIQMYTYIWEKILSKGEEEDDFEIQLIESSAEKFGLEKPSINDTKKTGNERAKITKAILSIESGKVAYNKLKAFEKTVLLCLMLTECETINGKISPESLKVLRNIFNDQFNITSNVMTVIIEKKLDYSITKKVEQVEVYREKYELVEFLWEKILSSEPGIDDAEMALVRKWIRRLDISDVESEGARKEVEANLNP
jgi:hypothetical protein